MGHDRLASPPMTVHGWLRYDVVRRLIPSGTESLLEIGAGKGAFGSLLARRYRYVGLEPDRRSFEAARAALGTSGSVLPVREEEYAGGRFDVVCALEVLEHLEDDLEALRRWQRHLRPGGVVIVSVPAGRARFGRTDERQGHFRRYDREDLSGRLIEAGFSDIALASYGFPIGYLLHAASNVQARRKPHALAMAERTAASGRWMQPSRSVPRRAFAMPFALVQRPFAQTQLGTGLVARAALPVSELPQR